MPEEGQNRQSGERREDDVVRRLLITAQIHSCSGALAHGCAVLIRHIPSTWPRELLPAGVPAGVKSANTGVHPGLLLAINLSSLVSFEACSCFYCKISVKSFMEANIRTSTLPNLICFLIRGLDFVTSHF